jgi:hypothetical protein
MKLPGEKRPEEGDIGTQVRSQKYGTRVHSKSTRKWKATFRNLEQEEDEEFYWTRRVKRILQEKFFS